MAGRRRRSRSGRRGRSLSQQSHAEKVQFQKSQKGLLAYAKRHNMPGLARKCARTLGTIGRSLGKRGYGG